MKTVFSLLFVPLILINSLAGIVAGVWLVGHGEWRIVLVGLTYYVFGHRIIGMLLMPGMLLVAASLHYYRKPLIVFPFFILSRAWTYALITGSYVYCSHVFLRGVTELTVLPYLTWSYAVVSTQWAILAHYDLQAGNDSGLLVNLLSEISYLVFVVVATLGSEAPMAYELVFYAGMSFTFCLDFARFVIVWKTESYRREDSGYEVKKKWGIGG